MPISGQWTLLLGTFSPNIRFEEHSLKATGLPEVFVLAADLFQEMWLVILARCP